MNFHIMTLFPEMIESGLNTSILGRAVKAGLICIETANIRDYTNDIHGHVDDYPYGGGAGMVMQAQPIYDCCKALEEKITKEGRKKPYVIYMSPAGSVFSQKKAKELAKKEDLVILCGHYEGVDERVIELIADEEISIGDYILTGGELSAMVVIDAVSRMVPGVLNNEESGNEESFSVISPKNELTKKGRKEVYEELADEERLMLLEYPQYTRPEEFMGLKVPEVLLSGHHENILKWRRKQALERTKKRRPDILP